MEKVDYKSFKLKELQNLAKENGIKNVGKLKKDELISLLKQDAEEELKVNEDAPCIVIKAEDNGITYTDPV